MRRENVWIRVLTNFSLFFNSFKRLDSSSLASGVCIVKNKYGGQKLSNEVNIHPTYCRPWLISTYAYSGRGKGSTYLIEDMHL